MLQLLISAAAVSAIFYAWKTYLDYWHKEFTKEKKHPHPGRITPPITKEQLN